MFVLRYLGRSVDTLLDRIFSALGAVALSQIPQLISQYYDVLTGALAEAKTNVDVFRAKAAELELDLQSFINEHITSGSPIFRKSGEGMQLALDRYEAYGAAQSALRDASVWERPFVFFQHLDATLFAALEFRPGLPLTVEGAVYALVGIVFGLGVYHLFRTLPVRLVRGPKKKRLAQNSSGVKSAGA
ncbi:MAG: DUF2937 family protein [bacterium]|nr:DUF2937 family protein [bacterium]